MKKIISLFQRNYDGDRLVLDEVVSGAEWVIAGEGTATREWFENVHGLPFVGWLIEWSNAGGEVRNPAAERTA